MKVLNIIKKVIIGILAVVFFCFTIAMTVLLLFYNKYGVTQFGDTSLIIIREQIASNNYKKGDLVFVEAKKINEIKVGNEVFTYKVDKNGVPTIDLGIVGEVHPNDEAISFKNGSTYAMDYVIGTSNKVYNNVGTYLSIIESKWGFLCIVLIPFFIMFICQIYNLIVEIKYGSEEEKK